MGTNNPKGYNNDKDWVQFENEPKTTIVIDTEKDFETENYLTLEDDDVETVDLSIQEENFDEVLQLTQYDGGLTHSVQTDFVVAEYDKIDVNLIDKKQERIAKNFVSRITKFVLDFNDVALTEEHKKYIRAVGALQLDNLKDLLSLVDMNKQMINNIVSRVNATQAEDYAIINTYNNLVNQQIKLIKDLTIMYKSIPSVIKKMRADVLTNQELENNGEDGEGIVTEDFGETQFNNGKQLLKTILQKKNSTPSEQ